jgi:RNA polymerase sigma factor (sigma-70 family)
MSALKSVGRAVDFDRLYRRHAPSVYRYTYAVLGNHADAEDVTQQVFLNAYRACSLGTKPRKAENWLLRIAHNEVRRHFRARQRNALEVELDEQVAQPAHERSDPSLADVLRALRRLPPTQREALVLREFEGRPYAEIARIMGMSQSALEAHTFRARRALAEQLEGAFTCDEAEEAVLRRLDRRLPRRVARRLKAHLHECRACVRFANVQMRQRALLRGLSVLPFPASLFLFRAKETAAAGAGPQALAGGSAVAGVGTAAAVGTAGTAAGIGAKAAAVAAAAAMAGGVGVGVAADRDARPTGDQNVAEAPASAASDREIVRVVRRSVRAQSASTSPIAAPSRSPAAGKGLSTQQRRGPGQAGSAGRGKAGKGWRSHGRKSLGQATPHAKPAISKPKQAPRPNRHRPDARRDVATKRPARPKPNRPTQTVKADKPPRGTRNPHPPKTAEARPQPAGGNAQPGGPKTGNGPPDLGNTGGGPARPTEKSDEKHTP